MKRKKGITLISLVISIIVLLILAGVSISLVVGNNGVLTQASNAVIESKKAKAIEEVKLAWTSAKLKYYGDWTINSTVTLNTYLEDKNLLSSYAPGTFLSSTDKGDGTWEVEYQADDTEKTKYTLVIDENGNIQLGDVSNGEIDSNPVATNYTVKFYETIDASSPYVTKNVNPNETIGENMPDDPSRNNYSFAGWKNKKVDSEFGANTIINENTEVYAEWYPKAPIVGFNPNDENWNVDNVAEALDYLYKN